MTFEHALEVQAIARAFKNFSVLGQIRDYVHKSIESVFHIRC